MPKSGMRRHRIIKINLPLAAPLANRQDSCVLPPDLVRYEKKGRRLRRKESVCMEPGFIDLTAENIADQHLCCIIRSKKPHPGVEAKRRWLVDRLPEGHVFRKLDVKEKVFIEYAPLETAWVPVEGDNYLYLYCLWVAGAYKGKGYGRALMEHCLADARDRGKSGICMLGAENRGLALRPVLRPERTALRRWMNGLWLHPAGPILRRYPPPLYGPSQGGDHR